MKKHTLQLGSLLFILQLLALLPLFASDVAFKDDIGRVYRGYRHWSHASRYLSDFLAVALHTNTSISDISPLPQLLALLLMTLAGMILVGTLLGNRTWRVHHMLSVLPLALSPYFLECFSFKFDAVYMALSVLLCLLPMTVLRKGRLTYGLVSFLCLLGMTMTYQASSGIYPMVVLFLFGLWWNKTEEPSSPMDLPMVGISVLSWSGAMILDKVFFVHHVPGYVSASLPPLSHLPRVLFHNYSTFYYRVYQGFPRLWLILSFLILLSGYLRLVISSKRSKPAALLMNGLLFVLMSFLVFGVLMVLEPVTFSLRLMYGFGVMLAIVLVYLCRDLGTERAFHLKLAGYVPAMCGFLLCWCFFIFAFIWGNVLKTQTAYVTDRMEQLAQALSETDLMIDQAETYEAAENKEAIEPVSVQIDGFYGIAPSVQRNMELYPLLRRLLPSNEGKYEWNMYWLEHYSSLPEIRSKSRRKEDFRHMDLPLLKKTAFFSIYGEDHRVYIKLVGQPISAKNNS